MNQAGERNAILLLAGGQAVGITNQGRLKVSLMEALTKDAFQKWAHTLLWH